MTYDDIESRAVKVITPKIQSATDLGIETLFLCMEMEYLLVDLKETMERDLQKDVVNYYDL